MTPEFENLLRDMAKYQNVIANGFPPNKEVEDDLHDRWMRTQAIAMRDRIRGQGNVRK